ncbi:serine/threonine protein kinase [Patescibacteria group bacterium]|nr:MAG: serine/threonine protein kinase [Patescibacteria group bacterium]
MLRGSWGGTGGNRRHRVSRMFLRARSDVTEKKASLHLVTEADTKKVQQDPFVGKTLSKNYTLIRLLGEGGMGKVYLAMNEGLKRRVAVKVLEAGKGGSLAIERFNAEAKTAAQIESPHVVAVTDHFSDDAGNHFIVMEFVDGPDMETILEAGVFTVERLMPLVRQIGRGLAAAHRLGIVHRDLKCENVIVIRMDDEGEFAKILDFGIAKIVNEAMQQKLERRKLTHDDTLFLGTPWYMAPEQALGKVEVDQRTDVYAFGVLVYRALTGQYPIDGHTITEVYSRLVHDEDNATPITVYAPEHAHLWPVLHKAMAKDRDQRYPDAKSFVDALEDAAGVPRLSRTSGMHAAVSIGHAPTLDVTGARKAPKHDKEAATLDAPGTMPAATQAPSLRMLVIALGALLTVAVGAAYVITGAAPRREPAPTVTAPVAPDPEPEAVPEPVAPVVRLHPVTPRVEAPVRAPDPPVPSRVEAPPRVEVPVVRTEPVAPVAPRVPAVAPTMELSEACEAALRRRGRGAGRAECVQYHTAVCGGARRTPWCDLIEATLHLPRPR